jgi:predicted solute-binding protein
LPKLRISVVQYLNTSPLVWGFTHGLLAGKYDLSFTVPSQCAEQLRAGDVDIAIIPAIEYQRIDDLVILPDLAIASKRRVRSLLLISKVPLPAPSPISSTQSSSRDDQSREHRSRQPQPGPRSIALDRSSRSTQALTKILCARHWQIAPQFQEMSPDLAAMLAAHDAALLIGDPALRVSLAIEPAQSSSPSPSHQLASAIRPGSAGTLAGGFSSPSARSQNAHSVSTSPLQSDGATLCDAATLGISPATLSEPKGPTTDKLYVYDIVEQWRAMTGLSAVLAVWAARPAVATPEVVADFHASRAFGLLNLPELCDQAAAQLQLPAADLQSYLTDNIDFTLDTENVAALTRFFVEAYALDLTPASKPALLAPGPKPVALEPALANPH